MDPPKILPIFHNLTCSTPPPKRIGLAASTLFQVQEAYFGVYAQGHFLSTLYFETRLEYKIFLFYFLPKIHHASFVSREILKSEKFETKATILLGLA